MNFFYTRPLLALACSALLSLLLVGSAIWRVWRRPRPSAARNAQTAQRWCQGFALLALVWLGYAGWLAYARFWQSGAWRVDMLLDSGALWAQPLFIGAVAWAAGIGVAMVLRLLRQESDRTGGQPGR